jgi:hypothetical protein
MSPVPQTTVEMARPEAAATHAASSTGSSNDSIAASRSAVRGYRGAAVFSHSGRGDQPGHKNARSDQLGTGSVPPLLGRGLLVGAARADVAHDVRPLMVARNTVGRTRSS